MAKNQQENQAQQSDFQNYLNSLLGGQSSQLENQAQQQQNPQQYKKGGKVRRTGKAKVHKGEYVVKKSAAQKQGTKKLAALNRGKADIKSRSGLRRSRRP